MFKVIGDFGLYILYHLIYYCTYLYSFIGFVFKSDGYELGTIHVHTNYNEYIEYKKGGIYNNYNFIKINYKYNNHPFTMIIKDTICNIDKYYPPYKQYLLKEVDFNIKKILTATITYNDNMEKDVTDIINQYTGPLNNFYNDITDYTPPTIQEIWGDDVNKLQLLTDDVQDISIIDNLII
jgi:hypothetical protein